MREFYSSPSLIDISVTKRCNLKCEYCSASSSPDYDSSNELTLDEFKEIFKELNNLDVHRVALAGGEPFMREDFFSILEEASNYRFATVINTNGTLITEDIAKQLTNFNFDRICVTLDGSKPEYHDVHRGAGTFNTTIRGIKLLQKYNLPVSTLFTLNDSNMENLIDCIKFNEILGIQYMTVMVLCPTGRASNGELLLNKERWYPLFLKLTEMIKNNEIKLNFKIVPPNESEVFWLFYFPLKHYDKLDLLPLWNQKIDQPKGKREISCQAGVKACSIDQNGDIYGCDLMMGIDEFIAGNIREQSFEEIWNNSPLFNKFRSFEFDKIKGKCSKCELSWCGAGCRSASYNLNGDILNSDDSCFYSEEVLCHENA